MREEKKKKIRPGRRLGRCNSVEGAEGGGGRKARETSLQGAGTRCCSSDISISVSRALVLQLCTCNLTARNLCTTQFTNQFLHFRYDINKYQTTSVILYIPFPPLVLSYPRSNQFFNSHLLEIESVRERGRIGGARKVLRVAVRHRGPYRTGCID